MAKTGRLVIVKTNEWGADESRELYECTSHMASRILLRVAGAPEKVVCPYKNPADHYYAEWEGKPYRLGTNFLQENYKAGKLTFKNRDSLPKEISIECTRMSAASVMEWYASSHRGDDYDVEWEGEKIAKDADGCALVPLVLQVNPYAQWE